MALSEQSPVEPVVRDALAGLLGGTRWSDVREVGGWWPRTSTPEIDLVAADRRPAREIAFVGSIKWRTTPITTGDVDTQARDATSVPGVGVQSPLVAVCPGGGGDSRLAHVWTADDLLAAWP